MPRRRAHGRPRNRCTVRKGGAGNQEKSAPRGCSAVHQVRASAFAQGFASGSACTCVRARARACERTCARQCVYIGDAYRCTRTAVRRPSCRGLVGGGVTDAHVTAVSVVNEYGSVKRYSVVVILCDGVTKIVTGIRDVAARFACAYVGGACARPMEYVPGRVSAVRAREQRAAAVCSVSRAAVRRVTAEPPPPSPCRRVTARTATTTSSLLSADRSQPVPDVSWVARNSAAARPC